MHNFLWISTPAQSCLILNSFCTSLLHSLTLWLIVSSLSLHNQHLVFCCVSLVFGLTELVLMALFSAVIRSDSVSLSIYSLSRSSREQSRQFCGLKYLYDWFSFHFCCLVFVVFLSVLILSVLLLAVVINVSLFFLMYLSESLNRWIFAILNAGEFPSSFFSWYNLSVYVISSDVKPCT